MKILGRLLGLVALLLGAASYHLWYVYAYNQPHFSYPEYGQIYAMNAYSWTVYLTWSQELQLYGLAALAVIFLVAAVALDIVTGRPKPEPERKPDRYDAET